MKIQNCHERAVRRESSNEITGGNFSIFQAFIFGYGKIPAGFQLLYEFFFTETAFTCNINQFMFNLTRKVIVAYSRLAMNTYNTI